MFEVELNKFKDKTKGMEELEMLALIKDPTENGSSWDDHEETIVEREEYFSVYTLQSTCNVQIYKDLRLFNKCVLLCYRTLGYLYTKENVAFPPSPRDMVDTT